MATGGAAIDITAAGTTTASSKVNLQAFHQRCGRRITLTNGNRTATRSVRDFSHALVFSAEPLIDDILFEVVIEKKNHSWGGSIEIGVTSEPPEKLELPSCATVMRNGTWVMSGIDVRKDGMCLTEFYGTDLEMLNEMDRVGVMRTSNNELVFYVNGESQGVAARNMPKTLWALVDLYGRCVQVSLCPTDTVHGSRDYSDIGEVPLSVDITVSSAGGGGGCANALSQAMSLTETSTSLTNVGVMLSLPGSIMGAPPVLTNITTSSISSSSTGDYFDMNDRLRFHTRCGSLVKLSPNCRSAERRRPLDEFNNGVVMTHRPLRDNELFEIRIDKLVDKWSGSIEVGVTTHNPSVLHFPATMTNMRSGTIMMSGCGILTNGKGTRRQYGEFNLDELREGDRVGMMRKSNSNLHYYINGQDQGVAANRVATTLWGVIDLYGMTIKVTIVDRDEREQQNLVTRRNNLISAAALASLGGIHGVSSGVGGSNSTAPTPALNFLSPENEVIAIPVTSLNSATATTNGRNEDRLTFHPMCGSHATVTHSGRTALRPNASDDFNNGVILTRRPLRPNELFQVRLERVVTKWAGSVEIGVTTYSAEELDFPFTMTNVRSGTWMMTGNGVMHNGITVIEQYGENLDRLQVGDRVGVVRKDTGTLHFWVNGVDQGPAATNVPEKVYGVIDLYGQAAQASIVDTSEVGSPDTGNSTISNTTLYSETPLRFHTIHGKNASISNGGLTASRPNSLAEFNDAIIFSNRPLRQRELFEVILENMVCHWSGNIEIGVTGTRPEDIQLASNATETDAADTIILCGPMIFNNRTKVRSNILIDLDTLGKGARVGVMRNGDYVHFYIDGVDQGPACECRSPSIWAVVDLYGQCAQVSLTQNSNADVRAPYATSENSQSCQGTSVIQPVSLETKHRWTCISGNVTLQQNWTVASRLTGSSAALSRCVVFSEHPLSVGSPFEIKLVTYNPLFAGCLNVGITDLNLTDNNVRKNIPLSIKRIPANVWYVSGNEVRYNSQLLQRSIASLEWLRVGDRIALELTSARTLKILLNSEDMNIQFHNIPNDVYVVVELQGSTMAVQVISSQGPTSPLRPCSLRLQDSLEFGVDPLNKQDSMLESIDSEGLHYEFSEFYGKNIHLFEERRSAMRVQSYNQGLVYVTKALCKGESINIRVDAVNSKWKGTIGLGVVGACPQSSNALPIPPSIVQCKRPCWVATHDYININGQNISSKYGETLMNIRPGTILTMTLTHAGMLVITMDSINLDLDFANGLPNHVYPVFDLYGKCERISITSGNDAGRNGTPIIEEPPGFERDLLNDHESNVPQCEKAYLEVHEKETESQTVAPEGCGTSNSSMNRSVLESVSENLLLNLSIKNRTLEQQGCSAEPSSTSSSCWLRESLQLQHNTNLNIQRSQGSQRFRNALLAYALSPCADNATAAADEPTKSDEEAKQLVREFFGNNTDYDDDYFAPNEPAPLRVFNIDTDSSGVGADDGDTSSNDNNLIMENSEEESGAVGGVSLLHELANDCRDLSANLQADANLALKQQQHENNTNNSIAPDTINDKDRTVSVENILNGEEVAAAPVDNTLETNVIRPKRPDTERVRFVDVATSELSTSSSYSSTNQFDSLQSIAPLKHKDCDYLKLVQQFRLSLLLPDTFFQSECEPVCFCPHCNAQASEHMQGWVYFKLNQQTVNFNMSSRQLAMDNENSAGSSSSGDEWLPLFYMTRVDKIRAILDRGQPLPMDSGGNDIRSHISSHQKDEPSSRLELHKSPNLAAVLANGQYMYLNNGYVYSINAAFEVYVKRQALCADGQNNKVTKLAQNVTERRSSNNEGDGCSSSSSSSTSFFAAAPFATLSRESCASGSSGATTATSNSNSHIQTWFTKEAGACIITALILRLKKQYSSHNKPA